MSNEAQRDHFSFSLGIAYWVLVISQLQLNCWSGFRKQRTSLVPRISDRGRVRHHDNSRAGGRFRPQEQTSSCFQRGGFSHRRGRFPDNTELVATSRGSVHSLSVSGAGGCPRNQSEILVLCKPICRNFAGDSPSFWETPLLIMMRK